MYGARVRHASGQHHSPRIRDSRVAVLDQVSWRPPGKFPSKRCAVSTCKNASTSWTVVSVSSLSRGGDVTVYVLDINQPSLPTLFFFCCCVCFCLYGSFNSISFHKFSRQLSAFWLCSSGLISAFMVLSTIYLFMTVSHIPWYNPLWLTGLKALSN